MKMKNETYDMWKRIAQYILPAIATCVISIFKIWHIPYGVEIAGTIMALDTLLGVILGISTYNYSRTDHYE